MLAREWGIPPWDVEAAPDIWIQRWLAMMDSQPPAKRQDSLI